MKRKITAILLAAIMLVAVLSLASCGTKDPGTDAVESTAAPATDAATDAAETDAPDAAELDTADWDYITGEGTLKIGITLFQPMNYYEGEELTGFDTEFAEALCEKLGLTASFIVIDWDTKETELKSKAIDCIWNGLTVTEERKENMDFTDAYMNNFQSVVIKADKAAEITSVEDLAALSIVAESGSTGEAAVQACEALKDANYTGVASQQTALQEVAAGTADVAVIDSVMAGYSIGEDTSYSDLAMLDLKLAEETEQYAIAFRKDSGKTLAMANEAIAELRADGTLAALAEKYNVTSSIID